MSDATDFETDLQDANLREQVRGELFCQITAYRQRIVAIGVERDRLTGDLGRAEHSATVINYGALSYMDSMAHIGIASLRESTATRLEALRVEQADLEEELPELLEELAEMGGS